MPQNKKSSCGRCVLCEYIHLPYADQLQIKQKEFQALMEGVNAPVLPFLPSPEKNHFRNKVQLPLKMAKGRLSMGFYKPGSHDIVELKDCPVQDTRLTQSALIIKKVLEKHPLPIHDEHRHSGLLKYLFLRSASHTDHIQVALVARKPSDAGLKNFVHHLREEFRGHGIWLSGLILNVNPKHTNVILGEKEKVLFGKAKLQERIMGLDFDVATRSFLQTNPGVTEKMYQKAVELLNPRSTDYGLDLFCGIGTITLVLAKRARSMTGIDLTPSAIQNAKGNALLNGVKNVNFIRMDLDREWPRSQKDPDFAVVDPPRQGCSESLLKYLVRQRIQRMVYISCNPVTLKRDLFFLREGGFQVRSIQPVDMFPYTRHVESITLLNFPSPKAAKSDRTRMTRI